MRLYYVVYLVYPRPHISSFSSRLAQNEIIFFLHSCLTHLLLSQSSILLHFGCIVQGECVSQKTTQMNVLKWQFKISTEREPYFTEIF